MAKVSQLDQAIAKIDAKIASLQTARGFLVAQQESQKKARKPKPVEAGQ